MVRKRSKWTRARARRNRPKTPAPKNGWVIADLSRITGVSVRTLRSYISVRLVRPIERRGTQTRYARSELLRVLGLLRLRAERRQMKLAQIKVALDDLGLAKLEQWLLEGELSAAARMALGFEAKATPTPSSNSVQIAATRLNTNAETWEHLLLLPGLALHVSTSASPAVRAAAQRICDEYLSR